MRLHGVDFPTTLLDAQHAGNLVVFAGAGVSMPSPSDYPNFSKLADRVAGGAYTRESKEPDDRFLGRMAENHVLVHKAVRDILDDPASQPNDLHRFLLRLFPATVGIRLVTTNFDSHFTTAAQELFTGAVETYYAPALPLGRDFQGLVYLHGSVVKEPGRMVLTDSDFGRAYLTEGWATRFLQELFSHYTVLFVGYSHRDPVVQYLARGLPSHQLGRRYALSPGKDADHWRFLGIEPLTYPSRPAPDSHGALRDSLERWVEVAEFGMLDWEQRIRTIVEAPPSLDAEDLDFVTQALTTVATAQFVTRHARSPEWLSWMEGQEVFQSLFQTGRPVSEVAQSVAWWFADASVWSYAQEAFAVVQRRGPHLHPALWVAIARRLISSMDSPTSPVLARWLAVLLRSLRPIGGDDLLSDLLMRFRLPEDTSSALLLFSDLATPQVQLEQHFKVDPFVKTRKWANLRWMHLLPVC